MMAPGATMAVPGQPGPGAPMMQAQAAPRVMPGSVQVRVTMATHDDDVHVMPCRILTPEGQVFGGD
jgi:hypothetical protein